MKPHQLTMFAEFLRMAQHRLGERKMTETNSIFFAKSSFNCKAEMCSTCCKNISQKFPRVIEEVVNKPQDIVLFLNNFEGRCTLGRSRGGAKKNKFHSVQKSTLCKFQKRTFKKVDFLLSCERLVQYFIYVLH